MKYTNRLRGIADAIEDIERAISAANDQINYHEKQKQTDNGPYHNNMIEVSKAEISALKYALDYIQATNISAMHEFEEHSPILYEVEN